MDCFICDDCTNKLKEVTAFRDTCRRIHEKNHPSSKIRFIEIPSENIINIDEQQDNDQRISNTNELKVKREWTRKRKRNAKPKEDSTMIYNDADEFLILDATPISNDSEHETYAEVDVSQTKSRKCWTAAQKLLIIDFAEKNSNQ